MAIPIVNQAGMRDSLRGFGPDNQTDVLWEGLVDPRSVELTANDNTIYNFIWIDTKKGPLVVEVPPKVLGGVNDFWYRWVADVGITGEDQGKGGKYLVLPPEFKGDIPSGYTVLRPNTFGNWLFFRAFVVDGSTKPGVEWSRTPQDLSTLRGRQPSTHEVRQCLRSSGHLRRPRRLRLLGTAEPGHPGGTSHRKRSHHARSLRLHRHRKGQTLRPDERMKKILTDAANIGAVTARSIAFKVRSPEAYFYPKSTWRLPFFGGYKFETSPGVTNMDGYIFYYYFATGVTPSHGG
jgi:hypothetical protein